MNKGLKLLIPILSVLMFTMFISCTGESDTPIPDPGQYPQTGGDLDNPAGTGSGLEKKGGLPPVKAVSYDAQAAIKLYIKDDAAEGGFRALANGDYVEPFEQTIGITVSPRQDGEEIFVSNGSAYTEEAFINESGMYVCSFNFEYNKRAYLAQPLLIQVIYKDGYASKKKYVLATRKNYRAENSELVKPGLVISLGEGVFGGLSGAVAGLLGKEPSVFGPADNSGIGGKKGVMHLEVDGLISGDMIIMDTDDLTPGEGVRGVNIGFEDAAVTNIPILKGLLGLLINNKPLLSLGAVSFDLGEMLGGLGGEDSEGDLLSSVLGSLDIEKQLFFNAYGLPEPTKQTYAVLGGGLYIAEEDTLLYTLSEEGELSWLFPTEVEDPESDGMIDIEETPPPADIDIDGVKTGEHDMGVALSHYNLNQVLGGIAENLVVELPAAALPIPLAIPAMEPGHSQIVKVTINTAGLNIDLAAYPGTETPARMDILDMRMEYIQDGGAMWTMRMRRTNLKSCGRDSICRAWENGYAVNDSIIYGKLLKRKKHGSIFRNCRTQPPGRRKRFHPSRSASGRRKAVHHLVQGEPCPANFIKTAPLFWTSGRYSMTGKSVLSHQANLEPAVPDRSKVNISRTSPLWEVGGVMIRQGSVRIFDDDEAFHGF